MKNNGLEHFDEDLYATFFRDESEPDGTNLECRIFLPAASAGAEYL